MAYQIVNNLGPVQLASKIGKHLCTVVSCCLMQLSKESAYITNIQ